MNWFEAQMALIDAATLVAQFAVNWLVQSTLLIAAGLTIARLLRRRGSAVQSVVYRTTLATVLVCPLATWTLSQTGVSGWSVKLPAGWTYHEIESAPIVIDVSDSASGPTSAQPSTAPPASLETPPAPFPLDNDPAMPLDSGSMPPPGIAADAAEQAESPRVVAESPPEPSTATAPTMTRIFSVQRIGWAALGMTAGWLFLSGLLGTRLAVAWRRLARLRRGSLPAEPEILSDCRDLAALLNVSPPVFLRSAFLPSPCLVGLRKPAVMLPDGELSLPLRDTLIHELAHLKRHDCHWNLLRQAAVAAFFFQPLLWRLSRRIEQTAEEVCDDYVIHYGSDRQEYAHCLVDVAELSSAPIAAAGVGIVSLRSMLARRVTRILDTSRSLSTRAGNLLLAGVLIGGALGTSIVGLVGLGPQPSQAEPEWRADASDTSADDETDDKARAGVVEDAEMITVHGRIVDPSGRPVDTAVVTAARFRRDGVGAYDGWEHDRQELARMMTRRDGRFSLTLPKWPQDEEQVRQSPDRWHRQRIVASADGFGPAWVDARKLEHEADLLLRLAPDDVPISGRILDLEGQPVPDVHVSVQSLWNAASGEAIDRWRDTVTSSDASPAGAARPRSHYFPISGVLRNSSPHLPKPVVSGPDGRFRMRGLGRDRLAIIELVGPTAALQHVQIVTRRMDRIEGRPLDEPGLRDTSYHGAGCQLIAEPSRPIIGVIRDADTRRPIANATVTVQHFENSISNIEGLINAVSDERGRYRLMGVPKGARYSLTVYPPLDEPYFVTDDIETTGGQGLGPVEQDIDLKRGIWIAGRVTDNESGDPVDAVIHYYPFFDNPHAAEYPNFKSNSISAAWTGNRFRTDAQNHFRIVGIPGRGLIAVRSNRKGYRLGAGATAISGMNERGQFLAYNQPGVKRFNAFAELTVPRDATVANVDVLLQPVEMIAIRLVDSQRADVRKVEIAGRFPKDDRPESAGDGPGIRVAAIAPDDPRPGVSIVHTEDKIGTILSRDQLAPGTQELTVTLLPCATIRVRLVDGKGNSVDGTIEVGIHPTERRQEDIKVLIGQTDARGRFETDLIPSGGPIYVAARVRTSAPRATPSSLRTFFLTRDFPTLEPGETLDFGTIDITSDERPESVRSIDRAALDSKKEGPSSRRVAEDRSYSGHVTDTDGHPVRDASIWLVAWKRADEMRETLYELHQARYELGRTDEQGNFTVRWNAQVWGESAAEIMASRPMLAAHAPDLGLNWLPLEIFDDHPVASPKREELEVKIDKAFGAGRFAGRTLKLPPQQPIRGRLVDLESRPIPGVTVRVEKLHRPDMQILTQAFERSSKDLVYQAINATVPVDGFHRTVLHKFLPPLTTDGEGRFELTGIGRDQLATLSFHGDGFQSQQIHALGRAMDVVQLPHIQHYPNGSKDVYVGRDFTFALGPSIPVSGVVADFDTGMPVPETVVFVDRLFSEGGGAAEGQLRLDTKHMRAITDEQGRFRITGMPPGKGHALIAIPPKTEPYLMAQKAVSPRAEDSETTVEMQVKKGIWIQGRLTDKQSGEPIHGTVDYLALRKNPFSLDKLGLRQGWEMLRYWTDRSGHYRVVGLPGPGVLLARNAFGKKVYPRAIGAETVDGYRADNRTIPTTPTGLPISNWHLIKQIHPAEDAASFTCDLVLDAGQSIPGRVIGPGGEPVLQLSALGEVLNDGFWQLRAAGKFDVMSYDGKGPRQLFFKSGDETLVGQYRLEGDAPQEITVRLQPAIRVTGQLIESETGLPAQGYELYCEKGSSGYFRIADVLTDDSGRFEIKGLLSGAVYEMRSANPQHFSSGRNNFTVDLTTAKPGDVVDVGAVPRPKKDAETTVTGQILLPDGKPAAGALVSLIARLRINSGGGDFSGETPRVLGETTTNDDGRFEFQPGPLSSSTHWWVKLLARAPVHAAAWADVNPDADAPQPSIVLRAAEKARGRLVTLEGQPAAGVQIHVTALGQYQDGQHYGVQLDANGPRPKTWPGDIRTDPQGYFDIPYVAAGTDISFQIDQEPYARQWLIWKASDRKPDEAKVFPLPPAQIFDGQVVAEDTGKPLPGARLTLFTHWKSGSGMTGIDGRADDAGRFRLNPYHASAYILSAFAPKAQPYLNLKQEVDWPAGKTSYDARVELPRGILVRGQVVAEDNKQPIAGASVQYWPRADNPLKRNEIVTGWQGNVVADDRGQFAIAMLPGPGTLMIHAPGRDFVLQDFGGHRLYRGTKGGRRHYAHAVVPLNPQLDSEPTTITVPIRRGAVVTGRIVGPDGNPPAETLLLWRGQARPSVPLMRGDSDTIHGGELRLTGIDPERTTPVYLLDSKNQAGTVLRVSGEMDGQSVQVRLEPCGSCTIRYVDSNGNPVAGHEPSLNMVVTPGPSSLANQGKKLDELLADEIIYANFNRAGYWDGPATGADGRVTLNVLIPGATYRLFASHEDDIQVAHEFSVTAGQSLELDDITLTDPDVLDAAAAAVQRAKPPAAQASKASAATGPQQSSEIHGRVSDAEGQPVAGAHVAVIAIRIQLIRRGDQPPNDGVLAEGTTNDDGKYRMRIIGVSSKTHRYAKVIARKDGAAVAWKQINLDAPTAEVSLELPPEEPIVGRLVDIEGQPAAGVQLRIESLMKRPEGGWWGLDGRPPVEQTPAAWLQPVSADEQGRFTINGVSELHSVELTVVNSDRFAPQEILLNTGEPERQREQNYQQLVKYVKRGKEVVLPLAPAQFFQGVVTDEDTGLPVPHARLSISARQQDFGPTWAPLRGKADAEGRYRISAKPGTHFRVTAYPPDGVGYLAREATSEKAIVWQDGDTSQEVNVSLPRGVLVRGKVVELGSNTPVPGAAIQYVPERGSKPSAADGIITGWQAIQVSDELGEFEIAVLPGPGRLLLNDPQAKFVAREISDRQLSWGKPGGQRKYPHAVHKIDPLQDTRALDVTISLKPGATVAGRIVDEKGEPVAEALVISRLIISGSPTSLGWQGYTPPTLGGRFELSCLDEGKEYPVHFLDPKRRIGATVNLQASDVAQTVVLRPCGEAQARILDSKGQPRVGINPGLAMVVTPGFHELDSRAARRGELLADAALVAIVDRTNYRPGPKTDDQGNITFPALIPGATYRLTMPVDGKPEVMKHFSVEPGQQLNLGDITMDSGVIIQ